MNDKSFTSWHANSDLLITSEATPFCLRQLAKLCRVTELFAFSGYSDMDLKIA
jgi:hypothetical protein|tara:strand:+ start:661 stop:819 length:159 start_codon:yes stop_codon:yes gene_type:complete